MSFTFNTAVGDAEVTGSSAVYAVVVRTNLPEYAEHGEGPRVAETQPQPQQAARGEPDDAQVDDALETLVTIPERTITVKRSYSEFKELRDALCKLAGARNLLPELPGRSIFVSAKDLDLRRQAFTRLLAHIGKDIALSSSDAVCGFLSDVPKPDFGVVHEECLVAVREMLAMTDWVIQYAKHDIEIATRACSSSEMHMLRSSVLIPLPVERTHAHYKHTPNWARYTPDATFTHIEAVSELAGVMHVCYRVPVISSRDVVLYEAQLGRDEIASITPQGAAVASAAAVARSILHPHCPTRRGIVRARVTAVTLFIETGEGTQIVSYQHADPRGVIPAAVVNKALVRGKEQLKEMRRVMVELG